MDDLKVVGDRLIIKPAVAETVSPGGIIIPDNAVEKLSEGTVVVIGPDVKDVKVTDHVFYGKYSGTKIPGDDGFIVMRLDEVIAYKTTRLVIKSEPKSEERVGGIEG